MTGGNGRRSVPDPGDRAILRWLGRYLNLEDMGMILGYGCGTLPMTKHSAYPQEAYQLGNRLNNAVPIPGSKNVGGF